MEGLKELMDKHIREVARERAKEIERLLWTGGKGGKLMEEEPKDGVMVYDPEARETSPLLSLKDPEAQGTEREARLRMGRDVAFNSELVYIELELSTTFHEGGNTEAAFDQLRKEVVEQLEVQGKKLGNLKVGTETEYYKKLEEAEKKGEKHEPNI